MTGSRYSASRWQVHRCPVGYTLTSDTGGKSAGNPYMLMMQNMMNMMMTNPNMQEMMASQLQEMMVNPQMGMMQGGVSFPQTGNFAKPQTKLASETEGEGSHERSAAQSVHRYQSSSLPRAEEEHRPSIVNMAQPHNRNDIAKKIDDMFHEDVDDLDDFYDRYSKVPKAKEYSQVSKQETSHLDRRRQSSGQKDRRDIDYLNTGVDSYSRHYQTAGDNYGYRHSAVAEDNELLDTGKPSVLLHVESEMLPFSRNSHDFANNGSNRKPRHQDDDDYRETRRRDIERVDMTAVDRQPASRHDRPRAGDRRRGGRQFDGYDDDRRGLSSRDDDYVEARGYGAVDQSEVSRPSNRGGRRHNNYFTDVETRDESRGRSDNETFKDERPIRRRHEPDVSDLLNAGYGQHSDDQIRGPNRESDDRRLDNSRNNQDNHHSNVTGYINPHDDIPVGGNRKPNIGLGFRDPNGVSTEINKSPMTNYEDIPIKRGDPSIYEEAAANPRNIQEAKGAGRQLERGSNRGSPDNEGLAKRSVEQDPADEDDMDYQQPDYIDRPLNDHEAQQIKGGGKDFYQLLEEQLALEGGGKTYLIKVVHLQAQLRSKLLQRSILSLKRNLDRLFQRQA
jgi:hypothetical protein